MPNGATSTARGRRRGFLAARVFLPSVLSLILVVACGSDASRPVALPLDPDVPRWAGGCFLGAAPAKVVNATAAPDLRGFGPGCSAPAAPSGLVYLDRFDPVSGDGDVTVLSSAAGTSPVVVAAHGGGGAVEIGSTAARIDAAGSRLLTLANVSFVTGDLVEAPLPAGRPVRTIASRVRMENYDFTADGGVLYVANYDPQARTGDVYHVGTGAPRLIATAASRFDFVMYRLSPDRSRVAVLQNWTENGGGDLLVQTLPPGSAAASTVAHSVYRMAWSSDGHLVFRTVNADGISYALWSWDGASAPVQLAPEVASALLSGDDVLYTTGWSVLEQRASLHLVPVTGGTDFLDGAGPASLQVTVARPVGTDGVIAFFGVPPVTLPTEGELRVTRFSRLATRTIDTGVTIAGGIAVSPAAGFVAYTIGFSQPQAAGSANPQPGIAHSLRVAAADAGGPFELAAEASTFVAWDPLERFVAAVGAFEPAVNRGTLTVRALPDGSALLSIPDVGNGQFGFAIDGSLFWAIRDWDDAQRRGELVVAAIAGDSAWKPVVVADDVTWVASASSGRVLYGVRGGGKDGIWVGALPR